MPRISTRNYRLSLGYSAALNTPLYWPYMYHYTTQIVGLSPTHFGVLKGIYYFTVVLCEVPFGVVADRMSRRSVLLVGALANAVGCLLYGFGEEFATLAVAEVTFGFGTALASGATSALLYDSLNEDGRAETYARLEGRVRAAPLIVTTFALPATDAWLVRDGDPVLAYFATFGIATFGVIAAAAMREPARDTSHNAAAIGRDAIAEIRSSVPIQRVILYAAGIFVMTRAATAWVFNPVLSAGGIPVEVWGTTMAAIGLLGAICAWRTHAALSRWGDRAVAIGLLSVSIAMYLALAATRGPAVVGILCLNGLPIGMLSVLVSNRVNRLVTSSSRRATILSVNSMVERACYGIACLGIAMLLDLASLSVVLLGTVGLACLPLAAAALVGRVRPARSR